LFISFSDISVIMKTFSFFILLLFVPFASFSNTNEEVIYFPCGIASGDPLADRVIIWTYISTRETKPIVAWEISTDSAFKKIDHAGTSTTNAENDFTLKIDVQGLKPGTTYFYRFMYENGYSETGRTHTVSIHPAQLRFAVISCSNYEAGYFNAYAAIAKTKSLDAVIHLGDYIYEYAAGKYSNKLPDRIHKPANELITLQDYRTRYAQYRMDENLQEAHRLHPFITIWDDHEIANNAYMTGAQNHQADEGDYATRRAAAVKAYFEWQPIRELKPNQLYRSFSFGDLAELFMLDGRLEGREKAPENLAELAAGPDKSMLGNTQFMWLTSGVNNSSAQWKLFGNGVIFSHIDYSGILDEGVNYYLDMWDGYPKERRRLLDSLDKSIDNNLVILTGDVHSTWAFNLENSTGDKLIGAEFTAPGVTSQSFGEYVKDSVKTANSERLFLEKNKNLKYIDLNTHGYLLITVLPEKVLAQWFVMPVNKRNDINELRKTVVLPLKGKGLEFK